MREQIQNRLHYLALICGVLGSVWLIVAYGWQPDQATLPTATQQAELTAGAVATMDSPVFAYSPGWAVDENGADTQEPADPWREPSGVVTFQYQGQALALQLAVGNYWGYLYVTVDGEPANLLADIRNNHNSQQESAGYRTFYAPERQGTDCLPQAQWIPVHSASTDGVHDVRVEIWRSWGQIPLRGVAVDGLPKAPQPLWPGVALLIAGIWLYFLNSSHSLFKKLSFSEKTQFLAGPIHYADTLALLTALCAMALLIVGILNEQWMFTLAGYGLLACAALWQPVLWMAAILFSLPFYYEYSLPLLPGRAFNLIEMGILGGVAVVVGREIWVCVFRKSEIKFLSKNSVSNSPMIWLWALISWALLSALAAEYTDLALREWRTVFLASGVLALLLTYTLHVNSIHKKPSFQEKTRFLIGAWMLGGTVIGIVALWHYMSGTALITAEDVSRVRAFYGSPNNLALYLERTVMVGAALALFSLRWDHKLFWAALTLPQAAALLLTYSRGAILLGIPVGVLILMLGGWQLYRGAEFKFQRSAFRRSLFGLLILVMLAGMAAVILVPISLGGTERIRQAFDFSQGTGFLRIQMWRSAWQMALDHPLLGVGPDNFLYTFRSEYILPAAWQEPDLNHPHNWILDFWTRLGLPGLIFGLLFMMSGISNLWRTLRRKGTALTVGLLAAVFTALAHGMIDASYALPDLMMVWVLLLTICHNEQIV